MLRAGIRTRRNSATAEVCPHFIAEKEGGADCYQSIVISCRLPCASLRRSAVHEPRKKMPSLIPDVAAFESRLASLPVEKHSAREAVLSAGSKTGKLLFLRSGAVEVIKDGVQIARVSALGAVFGEQAILLDQPHTADVRTLEQSEFYVADAPAMFAARSRDRREQESGRILPASILQKFGMQADGELEAPLLWCLS
jgi:hypothetical protein